MKMQIDTSEIGWLKSIIYIMTSIYVWIESTGLNAYVLTGLFVLMASDMILGWIKVTVVKDLENPTSNKAKKGILAKAIMFVIPVVSGLIWGIFDKENAIRIVNLQLTALMIAEGFSNIGNAYSIYTGEVLAEFDAVTFIFKKTAEKIKNLLEKVLK